MDRRDFLKSAGVVSATLALPKTGRLFALDEPSGGWRTFEITTRVEVLKPSGTTLVWLPAALDRGTPFQKALANRFDAGGAPPRSSETKPTPSGSSPRNFQPE